MELELFHRIVLAGMAGVVAGMLGWLVAQASLVAWGLMAHRQSGGLPMPASPGDFDRRRHRKLGRDLSAWLASLLGAALVAVAVYLVAPDRIDSQVATWGWVLGLLFVFADIGFVGYMLFRIVKARAAHRFNWSMHRAVAGVLERTSLAGFRVFHQVRVDDALIDHVVLGEKGVFLVNTVARKPQRNLESRTVRLKAGKLGFSDGRIEGMPVGNAARRLSLLAAEMTRIVGHRVQVKSIIAVPGWSSQPEADANHLLLNESNLASLASWNNPDAYLMSEDLPNLEQFLTRACSIKLLD